MVIEPLYDKKFECKMCSKPFTSKKVRSRFVKVDKYDSDFYPIYSSIESNPLLYYVNVCPSCGFSFSDDSSPYFPHGTKEVLNERVCKKWVPHNFSHARTINDAIKTYKLSLYCSMLKKEKHISIAGLCIRLAWLYRSLNNSEQEQRFMKLAIQEYFESYSTADFQGTQVSEIKILYLIGELSRRTFNIEDATKYFSKVIEKQSQTVEKKIVEMAKEQWYEIRNTQNVG